MDDLTAELRLRGLEPPYEAIKHELALRFAGIDEVAQKKLVREFARQIEVSITKSDERPTSCSRAQFSSIPASDPTPLLQASCQPAKLGPPVAIDR
jgi:hypothetical protein